MAEPPGTPPHIGAFVISPLPVGLERQETDSSFKKTVEDNTCTLINDGVEDTGKDLLSAYEDINTCKFSKNNNGKNIHQSTDVDVVQASGIDPQYSLYIPIAENPVVGDCTSILKSDKSVLQTTHADTGKEKTAVHNSAAHIETIKHEASDLTFARDCSVSCVEQLESAQNITLHSETTILQAALIKGGTVHTELVKLEPEIKNSSAHTYKLYSTPAVVKMGSTVHTEGTNTEIGNKVNIADNKKRKPDTAIQQSVANTERPKEELTIKRNILAEKARYESKTNCKATRTQTITLDPARTIHVHSSSAHIKGTCSDPVVEIKRGSAHEITKSEPVTSIKRLVTYSDKTQSEPAMTTNKSIILTGNIKANMGATIKRNIDETKNSNPVQVIKRRATQTDIRSGSVAVTKRNTTSTEIIQSEPAICLSYTKATESEQIPVSCTMIKKMADTSKFKCEKKSVLPTTLLKGVTELVKKQVDSNIGDTSQRNKAELMIPCERLSGTGVQIQFKENEVLEAETSMKDNIHKSPSCKKPDQYDEVNPSMEMELDEIIETNVKDPSLNACAPEGKMNSDIQFKECASEFLHMDASISEQKSAKPVDNVYNLSDLFSGELERRRRKILKNMMKKSKKWQQFSKIKNSTSSEQGDRQGDNVDREERRRKPVSNYFVAIQITEKCIKTALKEVQDNVVSENKKLLAALNKISTLHLTMMVLSLNTEEDMARSRTALDIASQKLLPQYTDVALTLDVSGLGHFRNSVVFAKVKHEDQIASLKHIADVVEDCFLDQEIVSPDKRGFKPHVTIMKLSKVRGLKKTGIKKIDEALYKNFLDRDFGSEKASMLQLCSMMKPKDIFGYYQVDHTVQFAKISDTEY